MWPTCCVPWRMTRSHWQRWLPPIIDGKNKACFGVTEPNTGLNTLKLKTMAVRKGDRYVVNGQKTWISNGGIADFYCLFVRTGEAPVSARLRASGWLVPA